ncbi:LytR C-terminal domain-containing protein [Helcobacillus massiliensis]|uniref:LytR/CpsA/Psr regulator C-terminal domain-containing protein n=1 Tax=Helcobacillus massiliensis TaxID=521392 RepID=A0A839QUP8_9MICO|nr:LytR C-terminal domain-containing protein [Helcobacillus massiliensis]MCG7426740.1 LytR C-terminal domain-containing protein [Helcobacillus sp. ACRRO]MBB3023368.1 hypothetical protein [Helcobacillus massiliensis]MCT1557701.1 LytR C-terminal domain-containing protein [Helcobacillus massiliensis]MCT2035973.1 LytR C-terminal domain-containing protein [Helcobacillus massiliensis]MCT2331757.1 LytR C-terminal domain-containing protein [Helcobacillus massiliensis]
MAETDYPYPADEFDREAANAPLRGSHRADEPFWKSNLNYIVIAAIAVLALIGALLLISQFTGEKDTYTRSPDPAPQTTASAAPSDEASADPTEEEQSVDRTIKVRVNNASKTNGLAGQWTEVLREKGWENVTSGNGKKMDETTVFYRDDADLPAAKALAADVGAGDPVKSEDYQTPLVVAVVTEP